MGGTSPVGAAAAHAVRTATTWLFVPASRPDRFGRAVAAGADQVVLDLEDAVAPEAKDAARERVAAHLAAGADPARTTVRINGVGTPWHDADVALVAEHACAVMLPKAAPGPALAELTARTASGVVVALVETAEGVLGAREVAAASTRTAFGNVDLAAEVGMDPADRAALAPLRALAVLGAAAAGAPPPVDGVTVDVDDPASAEADAREALRHGFGGKLCVHPRQVDAVRAGFRPSEAEVAWAEQVLRAGPGASRVGGQMVDAPVLARAEAVLRRR